MPNAEDVSVDLVGTTPVLRLLIPKPFGGVVTVGLAPSGGGGAAVPTPVEVADDGFGGATVPTPAVPADAGLGGAAVPMPAEGWAGDGVEVPAVCANAEHARNALPSAHTNTDVRKNRVLDDLMLNSFSR